MKQLLTLLFLSAGWAYGQDFYSDLPIGPHDVGFKIVTIYDSSRVTSPVLNPVGVRVEGSRLRPIVMHIWYPAKKGSTKPRLQVRDYILHNLQKSTFEVVTPAAAQAEEQARRANIENFFGKVSDESWKNLTSQRLLARPDAETLSEPGVLLIGSLRPFSTTTTCEMLASNGFTVLMVWDEALSQFRDAALEQVPDLKMATAWAGRHLKVDADNVGAWGFSGSGFIPVLFAMNDPRVNAFADLESAIFAIDVRDSDYYSRRFTIPFMHIYNQELAKRDTHFSELEKMKFSKRYHVKLNQANWHHWNVATEGYLSCAVLKNRGIEQDNIRKSFVIANEYLLHFFNAHLRGDAASASFLSAKPTLEHVPAKLWDVETKLPIARAPSLDEFDLLTRQVGGQKAVAKVQPNLRNDSISNIWNGFGLNRIGYSLMSEKKVDDAIAIFGMNVYMHPTDVNWIDSLTEAYEAQGDKVKVKEYAQKVINILKEKKELTDFEKSLRANAEKRLQAK